MIDRYFCILAIAAQSLRHRCLHRTRCWPALGRPSTRPMRIDRPIGLKRCAADTDRRAPANPIVMLVQIRVHDRAKPGHTMSAFPYLRAGNTPSHSYVRYRTTLFYNKVAFLSYLLAYTQRIKISP